MAASSPLCGGGDRGTSVGSGFSLWNGDSLPGSYVALGVRALHPQSLASPTSAWDKSKAPLIGSGSKYGEVHLLV